MREVEVINIDNIDYIIMKEVNENDTNYVFLSNVNNPEDVEYIKKFNIINLDANNSVHSDYDYEKGEVIIELT